MNGEGLTNAFDAAVGLALAVSQRRNQLLAAVTIRLLLLVLFALMLPCLIFDGLTDSNARSAHAQ